MEITGLKETKNYIQFYSVLNEELRTKSAKMITYLLTYLLNYLHNYARVHDIICKLIMKQPVKKKGLLSLWNLQAYERVTKDHHWNLS
jgi:hypothetical protein